MADFSFGFTEGSFLLLKGQKHWRLRSVAEDLISNKQQRTERIYRKRRRHGHYKTLKPLFPNMSDFYSACENEYHVTKTLSVWMLDPSH